MNVEKLLILCAFTCLPFASCKDDEDGGEILAPRADFAFTPSVPIEGEEILFYADPEDNSGEIVEWQWHFGDANNTRSTKRNPYFTYEELGSYEVILKVLNASGKSMEVARTVEVLPPPPDEFPAVIAWEFSYNTPVSSYNDGSSSPVIGDDGTIYYVEARAGSESKLLAVTDLGESAQLKWASNAIGGELPNAPSLGPDGNIYLNAWVDEFAITKFSAADGSILWSGGISTDVSNNTPAIDSQGNVYHGSRAQSPNGGIYSWNADGDKRWEITNVGAFYAAPVISSDEATVYFLNTNDGEVWAINAEDGNPKWDAPVGLGSGIHGTSLSIDADGTIFYTTNAHVVAITDDGESGSVKWSVEVEGASNSGIVVGPEGNLYTGSTEGLLALDPVSGEVHWTYEAEIAESVPAVDVNGNVYVGTTDGKLIIVNARGQIQKELALGNDVVNSPTITDDGTVFVEATDNLTIKLYKIAVENSGPADSPWPMKGQNVKNTAVAL